MDLVNKYKYVIDEKREVKFNNIDDLVSFAIKHIIGNTFLVKRADTNGYRPKFQFCDDIESVDSDSIDISGIDINNQESNTYFFRLNYEWLYNGRGDFSFINKRFSPDWLHFEKII